LPTELDNILAPPFEANPMDVRVWNDDGNGGGQRQMGNIVGTLLASGVRTTNTNGLAMVNPNHRGLVLYANVTAFSGTTPTLQFRINSIDPITGTPQILWLPVAVAAAAGEFVWIMYPGYTTALTGAVNTVVASGVLTRTWSVDFVIGGTTPSTTFSLGYSLLL
jgi:hypothetical protein